MVRRTVGRFLNRNQGFAAKQIRAGNVWAVFWIC